MKNLVFEASLIATNVSSLLGVRISLALSGKGRWDVLKFGQK
jgi:hypothetical protein